MLASFVLATGVPSAAAMAQTILGNVVDDQRRPVAGVAVGVFDVEGTLVAQGRADDEGHFEIEAPVSGRYRLHVAHPGYRSVSGGPYDVQRRVGLELLVVMHRTAVALEELNVVVDRESALASTGYFERKASAAGLFFDGDEVERRTAGDLVDFLARVPSIEKTAGTHPFGEEAVRNPALYYRRGGLSCVPAFWLDGSLVHNGGPMAEPLRPDDWVSTEDVAGVEFYRGPASVPIQFAHSGGCAVLVVWTERSRTYPGHAP